MKSAEEITSILAAYDLTRSFRDASELASCSHHTVARYVRARDAGHLGPGDVAARSRGVDGYLEKIEQLVDDSKGKMRADVVHDKIAAMGFTGSERTTRRAVEKVKAAWRSGRRRVHRPWIAEPGMWAQYDIGDGPETARAATVLFSLWLSWCRYRIVIPLRDKTQASIWAACDAAFRQLGGIPAYLLSGHGRIGAPELPAGTRVGHPSAAEFGRHYGLTVATCMPYDPAATGGPDAVKLEKADLVPTDANLRDAYGSFAELEAACTAFCVMVNAREHQLTRRTPVEMLAEERVRLHPVPATPFTTAVGMTWRPDTTSPGVIAADAGPVPRASARPLDQVDHLDPGYQDAECGTTRHIATDPGVEVVRKPTTPASTPGDVPGPEVLTARQREVLHLIARGYSNRRIGHELHISVSTVSIHVSHILGKLKATNRTEAAGRLRRLAHLHE